MMMTDYYDVLVFNGSDVVSLCAFNRVVLSVP